MGLPWFIWPWQNHIDFGGLCYSASGRFPEEEITHWPCQLSMCFVLKKKMMVEQTIMITSLAEEQMEDFSKNCSIVDLSEAFTAMLIR